MPNFSRAVVTGGAGFVGSHLCAALVEGGTYVVCFDNFATSPPANLSALAGHRRFSLVHADVSEALPVDGEVDVVFHLASPASPADYLRLPIETMKAGSAGTMHALQVALRKGARFLLASTSEVYGDPLVHPQVESYWGNVNPIGPRSVYDESKRFAEALTSAYRRYYGIDTAIARIFNSYGPRMRPGDGRAIPNFVKQALNDEPITVTGDGSQTRSLCYIDDTVRGLLTLVESGVAGPVNIGSPYEVTMLELAEHVRAVAGSRSAIEFIDLPQDDPRVRRPDLSQARERLGWTPRVALAEGLEKTVEWFKSAGQRGADAAPAGSVLSRRLLAASTTSAT